MLELKLRLPFSHRDQEVYILCTRGLFRCPYKIYLNHRLPTSSSSRLQAKETQCPHCRRQPSDGLNCPRRLISLRNVGMLHSLSAHTDRTCSPNSLRSPTDRLTHNEQQVRRLSIAAQKILETISYGSPVLKVCGMLSWTKLDG
jgi:hypothetical protein